MAATALGAAALGACGKAGTGSPGDGPETQILSMEFVGGFAPVEFSLQALPTFVLTGSRAFGLGPQIEIYPSPALPPIVTRSITAAGVAEIRKEAERVGLKGPDKTYRHGGVADAPNTRFVYVDSDGAKHTIEVEALEAGEGSEPPGASAEDKAARQKLAEFSRKLVDLPAWLPEDSFGEEEQYEFTALRVFVRPYPETSPQEQKQQPKDWPLATPLASFGQPHGQDATRCGVVEGSDLSSLKPAVTDSNTLTPWRSGGKQYQLILRPLYPGESGCPQA